MTKLKMVRATAITTGSVVLSLGVVGFASAQRAMHHSWMPATDSVESSVANSNNVKLDNLNNQAAVTGEAEVEHNKEGGDAGTGGATNGNTTGITVDVSNPAATAPSTPADSLNQSKVVTDVKNKNDVNIQNVSNQHAQSGNAEVEHNGSAGDATTGNAANTNSTTISVTVQN